MIAALLAAFSCATIPHKPDFTIDVKPVLTEIKKDPSQIPDKNLRNWITDKLTECSTKISEQSRYINELETALDIERKKNEEKDKIIARKSEGAGQASGMKFQWYAVIGIILLALIGFFLWIMRNGLPGLLIPKPKINPTDIVR